MWILTKATRASRHLSWSGGFDGFSVGKKEDKLGIRASSTTELIFENCRVPAANVLGEVGKGYKVAIETLNGGRIGIGAQMIGVARGALTAAKKYIKEREQFGKPIGHFQAVQFQIAQAATELEGRATHGVQRGQAARRFTSLHRRSGHGQTVFIASGGAGVTSLCVELFGGYGYTKEYPVEKFYRDAKIGTIYEGTSNMQLQTIAQDAVSRLVVGAPCAWVVRFGAAGESCALGSRRVVRFGQQAIGPACPQGLLTAQELRQARQGSGSMNGKHGNLRGFCDTLGAVQLLQQLKTLNVLDFADVV